MKNPIIQNFHNLTTLIAHLYISLHRTLNGLLIIGILFQTLIFFIEFNNYEITVPRFVLAKIETFLSNKNLSYEASSIKIKLTGEINLENLKLNYNHFAEPIATCDHLAFNLSFFSLIFGQLSPEEITIRNGALFCPPSISPTGLNEALIKNFFGALSFGKRYTQIQQLDFDFQNISVIAEGAWNNKHRTHSSINFKNQNKPLNLVIPDYLSIIKILMTIKDQLSIFQKPVLAAHITENEKGALLLDLKMSASGMEMDNLKLGALNLKSKLQYFQQKITLTKGVEIFSKNINWNNNYISANEGNAQLIIDFDEIDKSPSIKEAKLSLNKVVKETIYFDSIELNCNLNDKSLIPGTIAAVHNHDWFYAKGEIDLKSKIAKGKIQGHSTLKEIQNLASQFIKENLPNSEVYGAIDWNGKIKGDFNEKLSIKQGEVTISSQGLAYNKLIAQKLYTEINFDSEKLDIQYIHAENANNHAKGSIYHNFKTEDYRYLLAGSIAPELLDPYLESWWIELMEKFKFSTPMPFGNLDIHGNLYTPNESVVYGELLGNNFLYQGIPIKELSLRLNSNKNELELIDLDMNSNQGKLETYTKFQYGKLPNEKEEIIYTFVKGSSSIPLPELDKIIELPEVHEIIKDFIATTPPQLTVKGAIYKNTKEKTKVQVHFTTDSQITFHQIPFSYMNFEVNYTSKETLVDNINVGFARGIGEGKLKIVPENNESQLSADLRFTNLKQELAVEYLQKLWSSEQQQTIKSNNYGGFLTLDLSAKGTLGNWTSFTGSGNISITQANLARINLFGILSQILSLTPFGIGSFHLTDATSDFFIQKNVIHFPNIHIFGSTASIDAKGNFYIETQQLAFVLDISPLNKKGIPIISQAMLVLAPITQSFQMNLSGTLQNPKWETALTPLGFGKKKGPSLPQKIDIAK